MRQAEIQIGTPPLGCSKVCACTVQTRVVIGRLVTGRALVSSECGWGGVGEGGGELDRSPRVSLKTEKRALPIGVRNSARTPYRMCLVGMRVEG